MKRKGDKMIYSSRDFNQSLRPRSPSLLHHPINRRDRQNFSRPNQTRNKLTELVQNFSDPQFTFTALANKSVGNVSKTLDNVQQILDLMNKTTPIVKKYGPIVKNIPTMYKLYRAINDSDTSNEQNDISDIKAFSKPDELKQSGTKVSTPKLYI